MSQPGQLLLHQLSQFPKRLVVGGKISLMLPMNLADSSETGTTASAGFVILASQSTFSSEWALPRKQMHTWISSVNASENQDPPKVHCLSCSPFVARLKSLRLSSSKVSDSSQLQADSFCQPFIWISRKRSSSDWQRSCIPSPIRYLWRVA